MKESGDLGAQAEVDYFRAEQALKRAENRLQRLQTRPLTPARRGRAILLGV